MVCQHAPIPTYFRRFFVNTGVGLMKSNGLLPIVTPFRTFTCLMNGLQLVEVLLPTP